MTHTAYTLAMLWQAWLEHCDEKVQEDGEEFLSGCWCPEGDCETFNAACSANAAVIEEHAER